MFLFGHLGITLAAVVLGSGAITVRQDRGRETPQALAKQSPGQPEKTAKSSSFSPADWTRRLSAFLDVRLLLLGSMLPDIIDKPVGHLFFDSTFHNGRIFTHTLLVCLAFWAAGLWLYRQKGKTWLLALALGVLAHLVLDSIWLSPQTLFWPLYGWHFPSLDDSNIIGEWLASLFSEPAVYLTEIAGLIIMAIYGAWLMRTGKIRIPRLFRKVAKQVG